MRRGASHKETEVGAPGRGNGWYIGPTAGVEGAWAGSQRG